MLAFTASPFAVSLLQEACKNMNNEEEEELLETQFADIPKAFYSEATGQPFERCNVCEKDLRQPGTWYMVEKAVKRYPKYRHQDVIFEYAICERCQREMYEKLSTESRQRMAEFMEQRVQPSFRTLGLYAGKHFDLDSWLGHCAVTQQPMDELTEYQIMAPFNGSQMAFTAFPMMLSMNALDEMVALLSNQSLDVLNGFKDDITGMPPDLHELFKESRFVVM